MNTQAVDFWTNLDKLVSKVTAFDNFADMEKSLMAGYVPTIHQKTKACRELTEKLQAMGYRVWPGHN
jgi:hypothetical protein